MNIPEGLNELESRLVAHVNAAHYQPVKPRVIARQLQIPRDKLAQLRRTIKSLVRKGHLLYGDRHLVKPIKRGATTDEATTTPAPPSVPPPRIKRDKKERRPTDGVFGKFHRAAGGFGFVRPEGTAPSEGREADIFIPAKYTSDAANGDLVHIVLSRGRNPKRPQGQIIEIIERRTHQFVGTYQKNGDKSEVLVDGTLDRKSV
ncbi:MAG: hypothetical protein VB855_17075, partial [Pirellulaceae bacterium]